MRNTNTAYCNHRLLGPNHGFNSVPIVPHNLRYFNVGPPPGGPGGPKGQNDMDGYSTDEDN